MRSLDIGDSDHCLTNIGADLHELLSIFVVRHSLYNSTSTLLGITGLEDSDPTNTPSIPSCIINAASAGVATPPAAKFTTGRRPSFFTS